MNIINSIFTPLGIAHTLASPLRIKEVLEEYCPNVTVTVEHIEDSPNLLLNYDGEDFICNVNERNYIYSIEPKVN